MERMNKKDLVSIIKMMFAILAFSVFFTGLMAGLYFGNKGGDVTDKSMMLSAIEKANQRIGILIAKDKGIEDGEMDEKFQKISCNSPVKTTDQNIRKNQSENYQYAQEIPSGSHNYSRLPKILTLDDGSVRITNKFSEIQPQIQDKKEPQVNSGYTWISPEGKITDSLPAGELKVVITENSP